MSASQKARRAEVEVRYRRRLRKRVSLTALRLGDLNRLLTARYGELLPNDDAGRDDLVLVAHHLAACSNAAQRIQGWVRLRAPWLTIAELEQVIADAVTRPRRWTADRLAWRLGLNAADRKALRITTIGAIDEGKGTREQIRREAKRLRKEQLRRAKGMKPRHEYEAASANRTKPWIAAGMSRAKWYRLRNQA